MAEEPLCKRLDAALRKPDYSPDDILSLLNGRNGNEIKEACKNSFEVPKCFQLDFMFMCGNKDACRLVDILDMSEQQSLQSHFMWQVLTDDSSKSAFLKFDRRHTFAKWKIRNVTPHPYVFGHGKHVLAFDAACRKMCRDEKFAECFAARANYKFERFFDPGVIGYSLFQGRILSTDVFSRLNLEMKWEYVRNLQKCGASMAFVSRFVMSALESPDLSPTEKTAILTSMSSGVSPESCNFLRNLSNELYKTLETSSSFGEFDIRRRACAFDLNIRDTRRLIMFFLYFRPKWLAEWYETDPDEVDSVVRCKDVVDELVKKELNNA